MCCGVCEGTVLSLLWKESDYGDQGSRILKDDSLARCANDGQQQPSQRNNGMWDVWCERKVATILALQLWWSRSEELLVVKRLERGSVLGTIEPPGRAFPSRARTEMASAREERQNSRAVRACTMRLSKIPATRPAISIVCWHHGLQLLPLPLHLLRISPVHSIIFTASHIRSLRLLYLAFSQRASQHHLLRLSAPDHIPSYYVQDQLTLFVRSGVIA